MAIPATQAASTYQAPPAQLLAGKTPVAQEAQAAATPTVNPNQQLYDALKAGLESQGPVGGSRSYRTKRNGDVVIINAPRSILPKTGIKTVDKVSTEITPAVENTRSLIEDAIHSSTRGAIYGGITGALVGIASNLSRTLTGPNKKNFLRMAKWAASLGVAGALISALHQGYKAYRRGSKKVTSSAFDALHGLRQKSSLESK